MSMLPIFYGKPFEDPYRHVDELSRVCEINHLLNVPAGTMKMKLFLATLRGRARDWFLKLGKEFTNWIEMEEKFLRKILLRMENHLCPKSHMQVYPGHERNLS